MSTNEALDTKIAEAYGRALAIQGKLAQLVDKLCEDPSKKSPKFKQALAALEIEFGLAADGLAQLRDEADTILEGCVLVNRNVTNMENSIKRLTSLKGKLTKKEDITAEECKKWVDDVSAIKTALEKRYQIKRVNSEKQASISSLTEQLKKKDEQIEKLNLERQEQTTRIDELTGKLEELRKEPELPKNPRSVKEGKTEG